MPRLSARLLLSFLVLCIPLQGFGVALARMAGAAHFHQADAADAAATDHDHDHHHGAIEHHHHDLADARVVVVDDDERFGWGVQSIAASLGALDAAPMARLAASAPPAAACVAPSRRAAAFTSHVAGVPERPPR